MCFMSRKTYDFFIKFTQMETMFKLKSNYFLDKKRKNLDALLPQFKKNKYGIYLNPQEQIKYVLEFKFKQDETFAKKKKIQINLRGEIFIHFN